MVRWRRQQQSKKNWTRLKRLTRSEIEFGSDFQVGVDQSINSTHNVVLQLF